MAVGRNLCLSKKPYESFSRMHESAAARQSHHMQTASAMALLKSSLRQTDSRCSTATIMGTMDGDEDPQVGWCITVHTERYYKRVMDEEGCEDEA